MEEQIRTIHVHHGCPAQFPEEWKPSSLPGLSSPVLRSLTFRLTIFIQYLQGANPCAGWCYDDIKKKNHELSGMHRQNIFTCIKLMWQWEMAYIEMIMTQAVDDTCQLSWTTGFLRTTTLELHCCIPRTHNSTELKIRAHEFVEWMRESELRESRDS